MVDIRQWWWCLRRCTHELLEVVDVEHIVQSCARRQDQPNGDVIDDLGDAVGPVVASL
jgi:hypothetical protein